MPVYLLTHSYPVGEDKFFDEVRIIGLYSSRKKAKEVLLEAQEFFPQSKVVGDLLKNVNKKLGINE